MSVDDDYDWEVATRNSSHHALYASQAGDYIKLAATINTSALVRVVK